jgi:hypothetical protein
MVEKRTTGLQRVLKAGNIVFGGGVIDCTVRTCRPLVPPSMSRHGAKAGYNWVPARISPPALNGLRRP